ncbi:hypothetical protein X759_28685 [Mesorhizobium sp. LSHC420B00]|nr:hypothetical protein X759_28685 [Mesorhizobium sp. LSHC420B00]
MTSLFPRLSFLLVAVAEAAVEAGEVAGEVDQVRLKKDCTSLAALMGFITKFGDGAADMLPLSGLNKRRVRALAAHVGAPSDLVDKIPTADLETLVLLRPEEDAYGLTYDQIDDFLEGRDINEAARRRILHAYSSTAHKRALPVDIWASAIVSQHARSMGCRSLATIGPNSRWSDALLFQPRMRSCGRQCMAEAGNEVIAS